MIRLTQPQGPGRSRGNLSYLEFIAVVRKLWEEGHPDIPMMPTQGAQFASFPVIVYGLEMRKAFISEPKPRIRQEIINDENGDSFRIESQRFENIVSFSVLDQNPKMAEEIIEAFEDFMMEYTGVFKELGASEFMYFRRTPDSEPAESGEDVTKRTVTYRLVTEKTKLFPIERLQRIVVDLRLFLRDNRIEYNTSNDPDDGDNPIITYLTDQYTAATPSS